MYGMFSYISPKLEAIQESSNSQMNAQNVIY